MEWLSTSGFWESAVALVTLTALEIVLGIDNVIFISILSSRLRPQQQPRARQLGIGLAMFMRVLLLLSIGWVMRLERPLFSLLGEGFSGRDLILIGGGIFLIAKSTIEIHDKLEGGEERGPAARAASLFGVVAQILALDVIFSLDSVITAVGMSNQIGIMVAAVLIAAGTMLLFSSPISRFISRHPTITMLALSFLILVGVVLVLEGFGRHVGKGYIYFAMAFSFVVEMLNIRIRRKAAPVQLRHGALAEAEGPAGPG